MSHITKFIKDNRAEWIIVLVFIFFAFGFNIYRVQSDGVFYYAFLEKALGISDPESPPGHLDAAYFTQTGCAYFNAPFYLVAYAIEKVFRITQDFNGITLRQIAINVASNFYMVVSLLLVVRLLKKMHFRYIVLPIISVLYSTTAFSAAVIFPSFNHTVDIFVNTLFYYLLITDDTDQNKRAFCLGGLVTACILVRYLNFVLMISAICYYLISNRNKKIPSFLLGFAATAWVVPAMFYFYNGTISPLYGINITIEGSGKGVLLTPSFFKLLVHPLHGLFVWSPVTLLSFLGLSNMREDKRKMGYLLLGVTCVFLLLHSFLWEWHAGWSFSNRYLVGLFPVCVIGLAAFLNRYGKKAVILVLILTLYSIFLFMNWHQCIMNGEFGMPQDMVRAWIEGTSETSLDGVVNLKTFLGRFWEMCRYKYIFRILK